MQFRTPLTPVPSSICLNPEYPVTLIGSCFSDNIGARMRHCLWNAENPFGTLYNPASIAAALRVTLFGEKEQEMIRDSFFTDARGISHSWLFDSKVSDVGSDAVASNVRKLCSHAAAHMAASRAIIVTFGTSTVYSSEHFGGRIVANCHKQPSASFSSCRLSHEECVALWVPLLREIHAKFPETKVIFTVSPVRHLKDGFAVNARSKGVLLLAVEALTGMFPDFTDYFPAYEILIDDLRDYRFYASDMVHPSSEAVEYIWEIFCETYLDQSSRTLLLEAEALQRAARHRPLIPSDPANVQRMEALRVKIDHFSHLHPRMLPVLV